MEVIINETKLALPTDIATWGNALDWIEMQHLQSGQCITRVLFHGQEEINYRKTGVCDQNIQDVGAIHIESGDFDMLVRESLRELDTEVKSAIESTREIIRLLESREEQKACNNLTQLLETVGIFYSVFSEDIGWSDVSDLGISRDQFTASLEDAIGRLISAQENRLWVSIYDALEYELTPVLEAWQKIVERTRAQIN